MIVHTRKAAMSVMTIVDPTGVSIRIETMIPISAQTTDITAAQTVTERKLLKTLIADSAGKIEWQQK